MVLKILRTAVVLTLVLLLGIMIGVYGVYHAAQQQPDFYEQALQAEPAVDAMAGEALEQRLLDLHQDAQQEGRWEAVFTEEQINGWLASDLPEKFPSLLPKGTEEPRVALEANQARIACRYERGKFTSIISFAAEVVLTEETNQLAIRVSKVRAGALPVPLKSFLDRIARSAGKSDIDLAWLEREGDPVALVTVPVQHEDYAHHAIYLETVEIRDGEIYLAGYTDTSPDKLLARNDSVRHSSEKQTVQR